MATLPPSCPAPLPEPYELCPGSSLDRARLLQFMRRTYRELYPEQNFDHLAQTVKAYLSSETPLWWINCPGLKDPLWWINCPGLEDATLPRPRLLQAAMPPSVGCLWMGTAVDQVSGDRHAHIFLLYVAPQHRRRGLGRALMQQAEAWARERGDRRISLQVFNHNAPALSLYESLGYQPQSIALVKSLEPNG